jgi:hypothetical protein
MGVIKEEVWNQHLYSYPQEEELLKPFLQGFDVTWGRRKKSHNSELSIYLLKPEPFMAETYGFSQEILLAYSAYKNIEARSIQAAEKFLQEEPIKGRVEKLTYFLLSEDDNAVEWVNSYTSVNQESRIIVTFATKEIKDNKNDPWFIRNTLNKQLYNRDLFDFRLPLEKDTYFFGREDIVASYHDAIKRSENRGLFGLRKTGKTSTLYKIERTVKADDSAYFLYYDCKLPSIRKLRWFELLKKVSEDLSAASGIKIQGSFDEINVADTFIKLISQLSKPAVLVFDEIEYISPIAKVDTHWLKDFVDFWQTFWACQSRYRKVSTIIAGVNPHVVELDSIDEIQNPLFGIVSYQYLKGLGLDEMRRMVRTLGRRMGMQFEPAAFNYMHERYGGHPLLTRIACSLINSAIRINNENRPVMLTKGRLLKEEESRDSDLMFYCRHVVSELRQFYPDEYEMLEMLASGQITDFLEFSMHPEYTKHLQEYGLLAYDTSGAPKTSIPVIARYVGLELARKENRKTIYRVVPASEREKWAKKRINSILHDIRFLEQLVSKTTTPMPSLFGPNSFPEADAFHNIKVCANEEDFKSFINACNRCFVESIEVYGKSISKPNYFWDEIKNAYPGLLFALQRIKLYRHNYMHLRLNPKVNDEFLAYLDRDLEGKNPSQVPELYFVLQQATLDGLLTGIQVEVNKLI